MPRVIEYLRSLDRKERFAVLREALGFHPEAPRLDDEFRKKLGARIGKRVPAYAFLAMDYHLDWIELALHLARRPEIQPGTVFKNPSPEKINKNQQDVDLLVAFEGAGADELVTHLVLIEAKAYLSWTNEQLDSKTERLAEIFGDNGTDHPAVEPHFVLMTERRSEQICVKDWPQWARSGEDEPYWLDYLLPRRHKVTRCSETGADFETGCHLRLDAVPSHKK